MSPERPPKVFISYSHDSDEHEQRVLNLANRLRSDHIEASIDQYEDSPREGWPVWMEKQIRESDFVLVVATATYLSRAERREEEGVGRGAIWETALTLQYLYNASANNDRFIPVVFTSTDIVNIPMALQSATYYILDRDSGCKDLLLRLRKKPKVEKPPLGSAPVSSELATRSVSSSVEVAHAKKPWNVPHQRNDAFTGREQLIADLRSDLVKRHKQVLSGLGGVGKTQIAVEYAYRHKDNYTAVLWTFADTEQSVRGGFIQIAVSLNLPEKDATEQVKVTEAVRRWLDENPGWLFVFDNADNPDILRDFLPQQGNGHILLTSRAHQFQKLGIFSPREVDVLSPDEARQFLLLRTGKEPTAKSAEADALAKELGYLPLALEQAAAYIVETGANFETYLNGFKKQRLKLLEKQGPVLGNDAKEQQKRTVTTTWSLNFADVEKQFPASADLLRLSAFLAPDAIPLELLEKGSGMLTNPLAEKLAEAAENPLVLDELLSPLLRFSLVRRDEQKRTFSIHPLVQEVVRDGLSGEDQRTWAKRTVRTVDAAFPDPMKFENWPKCDSFLPHALACAGLIEFWDIRFVEATLLLNQTAYYLYQRAEYAQAEPLYQGALAIFVKTLGPEPEHPAIAAILNNLALLYHDQGREKEAEPLYRRALQICEKVLGPEHPTTAASLNNLSELYRVQGKYAEAEPLYRRAMTIREKTLGLEHPDTAQSLSNLALLYRIQGKYAEAEPLYKRSLKIYEKALGPNHPDTAIDLNGLAELYRVQGQYQVAEPLQRRALAILEKALGPEHPDTATSLNNLALLLDAQGKYAEAEPLYRQALAMWKKALGSEHPNTTLVCNNLILFYRKQGKNAEANALGKDAEGKAE